MKPNWPLLGLLRFALALVVFNEHIRLVEGNHFIASILMKPNWARVGRVA